MGKLTGASSWKRSTSTAKVAFKPSGPLAVTVAAPSPRGVTRPFLSILTMPSGATDLHLWRADPSYLKQHVERFRDTAFVLLHCYPFVREAGWLAHVYGNVYFDLSLTIPHVARPEAALAEALELAPVSKLLYASDAARTPELYLLAASWWRDALAEVLPALLPGDAVEEGATMILRENARALYRLTS